MKAIPWEKLPRNWRSRATLCTTPFTEQCKRALTRIERGMGGPFAQLSKMTSTLVFSLRNRCLTSPQLVASWNSTRKTPVSTSTVKGCWPSRQSSSVQCLCSFAHLDLLFTEIWLFLAALPRRHPRVASSLLTLRLVFCEYYLMKLPVEDLWDVCFSN